MRNDSLKKRYFYKLSTNLIVFIINITTAGIVPRALGVENYGKFNYVTTVFKQIVSLLDLRSSMCFYTKFSQRQKENKLLIFYTYYVISILILLVVITFAISTTRLKILLFSNIRSSIIYYAVIYVILYWVLNLLVKVMDASGETVSLERMRIINKIISTFLILTLFFSNSLDLTTYFYFLYGTNLILIIAISITLRQRKGYKIKLYPFIKKDIRNSYLKEFYTYSKPLAYYVVLAFVGTTFDRWILQKYGGSFEQGLYSFSFVLSNFSFLFVTALIPLFTRELSVAAGESDLLKMAKLFRRYVPLLYAITAYFSSFIFVEIENLIKLFGGTEYLNAKMTLSLLAYYPLVSTYSNLNGSLIYATGRTKIFFKLTLFFLPAGMILSFLLISNGHFGLNLGATGLAIKELFIEFVSINVILFINSRFLKIHFWKYVSHMLFSVIPFLVSAYSAKYIVIFLFSNFRFGSSIIVIFLLSGILYSFFTLLFTLLFPVIFGLNRNDLINLKSKLSIHI